VTIPGVLAQEGLTDDEKLWAKLAASSDTELDRLLAALGIGKEQFLQTITPLTLSIADKYGPNWFERHWFDVLQLTAVALVLATCAFMVRRLVLRPVDLVVIAATDLRPFEPIRAIDVRLQGGMSGLGSLHDANEVVGRYPLREIPRGNSLKAADLSPRTLPNWASGRSVLRLSLNYSGALEPWRLPIEVTLLFAPRTHSSVGPLIVPHAYIVATRDAGTVTIVWAAVESIKIGAIANVAGNSDIFAVVEGR
jgi:hypothetical protein